MHVRLQRHHYKALRIGNERYGNRYSPAMMMQGSFAEVITVFLSAFIGTAIISAGFQGWLFWRLNWFERLVFIAGGMLMFIPGTLTDLIGIAIAVVLLALNLKKWERGPKFIMQRQKK